MYLISFFMYSYFRNDLPEYFKNYFTLNKNKYSYNTRSASNIFIDYGRKNYGKFSLKYRRAQIWNNLPDDLKTLKTYYSLKKGAIVYVQNQSNLLH